MSEDRPQSTRIFLAVAVVAMVVGLALRAYASLGDFWLDEIWSLIIAQQATSLIDLLHFKVDNNHLLNTILLRVMGDQPYWLVYRVPAIIAGVASIALAGAIANRFGLACSIVAMLAFAVSYPLVHYGSEARGYALAVMFMLGAILVFAPVNDPQQQISSKCIVAFWLCCALGMMSQPLFVQCWLAMVGWSAARVLSTRASNRGAEALRIVWWHVPTLLFASLLYLTHWRGMEVAGGAIENAPRIAMQSAALALGASREPLALTGAVAAIALGLFVGSFAWLWRRERALAVFVALATMIVPAIMLVVLRPAVLYERYFLLPITLALLMMTLWSGDLIRGGGWRRWLAIASIAAFVAFNLWRDVDLIHSGRGRYLEALEFIASKTPGDEIVIGSDHEFRNRTTIEFYARYLDKRVRYVPEAQWPSADGAWFILHALDAKRTPLANVTDHAGVRWELAASFDSSELSGFHWFVYRRVW